MDTSKQILETLLKTLTPGGVSPLHRDNVVVESKDFIKFPLYPPRRSWLEALMVKAKRGAMTCTVCGDFTQFTIENDNLRDTCVCRTCRCMNRQRQIAYVASGAYARERRVELSSYRDFSRLGDSFVVYNTESRGPVHDNLHTLPGYRCSEYFGPQHKSGDVVNGVVHQDLMDLRMDSGSVDLVISSDVFEHIPDPYKAHRELHRVLKPGGRHVFTVPFHGEGFEDEVRATIGPDGAVVHHAPPIYHADPVRPSEGVLVFNIFGLEMLVKLHKLGFHTNLYQLSAPWLGILGTNAIVFEAIKRG